MTVRDALGEGVRALSGADTPYLDAVLLLAEATGVRKERLLAGLPEEVGDEPLGRYRGMIARRAHGEPVAYLHGRKEFYGRDFAVDRRVLVPRPDSETLVEAALRAADELSLGTSRQLRVHDVGAGSGAIALTLKLERPRLAVTASDLSPDAEAVFRLNAGRMGAEVPFYLGSLLRGTVPEGARFDLIVSNPPYLTDREVDEMVAASWPEPEVALRAGPEGLDCIVELIGQSVDYLDEGRSYLAVEIASVQADRVAGLMRSAGLRDASVLADLAGAPRVVVGRR